jgi:hypothetical protein
LVFDDPGSWVDWAARKKFFDPIGKTLWAAGMKPAGDPVYFQADGRWRFGIPIVAHRDDSRIPESLSPHLVKVPARRVVSLTVRGDPGQALAALPLLVRYCREHGLRSTGGPTYLSPSLRPTDAVPKTFTSISTQVEVEVVGK